MRPRQEQVVFVVVVAALGLMGWRTFSGGAGRQPRPRGGDAVELAHHAPPEIEVALPSEAVPPLSRELFTPPRDTRRLPPLDLVEPPRRTFEVLMPPGDPGPAPRAWGALLRRPAFLQEVPDLFGAPGESGDDADAPAPEGGASNTDLVAELAADDVDPFAEESPAERAARYDGYRSRYDWLERNTRQTIFGHIRNPDRYGLKTDSSRRGEAILFVQLDPETGREVFRSVGAPAIPIERSTIVDFDFADTVANRLEVRRLQVGEEVTRGTLEDAMALADYAVRHRLEAPRALEIAEELYRACIVHDAADPSPRLGLARCYEAGFRFEQAYREYEAIRAAFPAVSEAHARLGLLDERFLLFEKAEENLRLAARTDRGSWEARLALGQFLARRERFEEAAEELRGAARAAPTEPELLDVRVDIRVALADVLFALGHTDDARRFYEQALGADPSRERARAGLLALGTVTASGSTADADAGAASGAGFDLLLARGLRALANEDWSAARDSLTLAITADPLRANHPLAALAFLAYHTGYDADAASFVEAALECDPGDAFALFLRGRLLGSEDDFEGARASLLAALEREVDFEDALVALGEIAFRMGRFEDAERYLERALSIDSTRPDVHALRSVNSLRLGSVADGRAHALVALELEPQHPVGQGMRAWCAYLDGEIDEALNLLANMDDSRREQDEEDPWRLWAREQIERITDHEEKVEWRDDFDRSRLGNGWFTREGSGPIVTMVDGACRVSGTFDRNGTTQVFREYNAADFVSFVADVRIASPSPVRAGIFIARERQRRSSRDVVGEASVSRHKDGALQVRFVHQGQPEEIADMQQSFATDAWTRLSIDRFGESTETAVTISLDGVPLVEDVELPSVGSANSPLLIGLFVEGQTGRQVDIRMDGVSVVYRGAR